MKHVAFDFHGVLQSYPDKFAPMMKALREAGIVVSIMSGPPRAGMLEESAEKGYKRGEHYDHLISITDYLQEIKKVKMWQDPQGNWWGAEEDWWGAKADLCIEFKVDVLYDDSIKYLKYFQDSKTLFLLVT